eukprot:scaffold20527_cov40-Phaeocystis_antarctica.AAC.1
MPRAPPKEWVPEVPRHCLPRSRALHATFERPPPRRGAHWAVPLDQPPTGQQHWKAGRPGAKPRAT